MLSRILSNNATLLSQSLNRSISQSSAPTLAASTYAPAPTSGPGYIPSPSDIEATMNDTYRLYQNMHRIVRNVSKNGQLVEPFDDKLTTVTGHKYYTQYKNRIYFGGLKINPNDFHKLSSNNTTTLHCALTLLDVFDVDFINKELATRVTNCSIKQLIDRKLYSGHVDQIVDHLNFWHINKYVMFGIPRIPTFPLIDDRILERVIDESIFSPKTSKYK